MKLTETIQTADWKSEKHVPAIIVDKKDGVLNIKAHVGEEVAHPNTLEHHIAWIKVFFKPEGAKFPIEVGSYEFSAHGEEDLFTEPCVETSVKTDKGGEVYALSYCNIHGLWENSLEV
ncbi:class II SORL domain-containing protein [Peptoniphilus sp.]|uniref:class II SORL domain-containing protein n=1 Tax=Peptoniphilus sp. TaxID=1971214 RepID=UPI003D91E6DE